MNERIKKIRELIKINQEDFGKLLGISRNAVANIENNRTEVNDTLKELICLKFKISRKWLEQGEGDMYEVDSEHNEIDYKIINLYSNLSSEHQLVVRKFIENMLENMPAPSTSTSEREREYDEYTLGELEDFQNEEKMHESDVV